MTIDKLYEKQHQLKKELLHVEKEIKTLNELPDTYRLADRLHSLICRANHIDQCGWDYESWDNIGYSKKRYVSSATKLILKCNDLGIEIDSALELYKIIKIY